MSPDPIQSENVMPLVQKVFRELLNRNSTALILLGGPELLHMSRMRDDSLLLNIPAPVSP